MSLLVVEDDEDLRFALTDVLIEEGYDVLEAENGAQALTMLRTGERPSLILLDHMMPQMSGSEFRAEQRADEAMADIPVVLMTASAHVATLVAEIQPDAALKKPVQVEELLSTIRRVLSGTS